MYDICCIGHITSDKIVTPKATDYSPGGTAWYFSYAVEQLNMKYLLVTAIADKELNYVNQLRKKGGNVKVIHSDNTVYFENIYGDNPDDRTQNVLQKADPFKTTDLTDINARIFHLGPLLADDIPIDMIKQLAAKGWVSLDVQGYLRKVIDNKVYPTVWANKNNALPYISTLKADVTELKALTGCDNTEDSIKQLADCGVKEIVITNGSKGSTIYADGILYQIPAYQPKIIVDATGCGDTYMAGYLYRRIKNDDIQRAGEFAAAMAALKMENPGPFTGNENDVRTFLSN